MWFVFINSQLEKLRFIDATISLAVLYLTQGIGWKQVHLSELSGALRKLKHKKMSQETENGREKTGEKLVFRNISVRETWREIDIRQIERKTEEIQPYIWMDR